MDNLYEIIQKPIISEKSTALAEVGNRYTFKVATLSNKIQIKEAVQKIFNVSVTEVRTIVVRGKLKRAGRSEKKHSNWKKAIVTVKEGQKIEFFQTK